MRHARLLPISEWVSKQLAQISDSRNNILCTEDGTNNNEARVCIWTAMTNGGQRPLSVAGEMEELQL
jgi:hypothetical protein